VFWLFGGGVGVSFFGVGIIVFCVFCFFSFFFCFFVFFFFCLCFCIFFFLASIAIFTSSCPHESGIRAVRPPD